MLIDIVAVGVACSVVSIDDGLMLMIIVLFLW